MSLMHHRKQPWCCIIHACGLQALKAEKRPDGVWYYLLHYNGWNKVPHSTVEA
jgi:hypothetical protein